LLPHYSLLGIKEPVGTDGDSATPPRSAPGTTRRVAWHPNHAEAAGAAEAQTETPGTAPSTETTNSATNIVRPRWRPVDAASQGQ
jgi:hypothetical protein